MAFGSSYAKDVWNMNNSVPTVDGDIASRANLVVTEPETNKIICNNYEEAVKYVSFSKDKTSSLEFAVGINSNLIKRITLLLCKDYIRNN